jgi:hypothetical protein
MIKARRMRWAGHVARLKGKRHVYRILVGKLEESMGWYGLDSSGYGPIEGSCEHGNEPLGSIKH